MGIENRANKIPTPAHFPRNATIVVTKGVYKDRRAVVVRVVNHGWRGLRLLEKEWYFVQHVSYLRHATRAEMETPPCD